MLDQAAADALYSGTYVEDYLDSVENLPDDIQRQISKLREMDLAVRMHLGETRKAMTQLKISSSISHQGSGGNNHGSIVVNQEERKKLLIRMETLLIRAQDVGDEKLRIVQQIQDYIDNKARQLEVDRKKLDLGKDTSNDTSSSNHKDGHYGRGGGGNDGHHERPAVKRVRRARHDVCVPSTLGPTVLEVTSNSEGGNSKNSGGEHEGGTSRSGTGNKSSETSGGVNSSNVSTSSVSGTGTTSSKSHTSHSGTGGGSSSAADSKEKGTSGSNTSSSAANTGSNDRTTGSTGTPKKMEKRTQSSSQQETSEKKKYKKRKSTKQTDEDNSPPNIPIDPDEPTYCLCDQISYGEMIGCDNDLCPIEWFHFSCVSLSTKPKGKWFCPKCRGDRPNIMKPKAIFLKELEKYNREKEEKS